mmetsp:Transcript_53204/g.84925  ORF Transcript_53204/g.84925 Transcript_53204/m.84925 type:complete len:471 (+) Transcript_53204:43-1455(+)|eukprot:CAMPEP_0197024282 /NCGR_PEP_ID=MMETSP1384-20130603/4862_1 /TAXON_ID=29189 /ORGANISM="Ammonia sp." /LENGTH=470 /DNA_ID=CAMNT_0042452641 /DNA_START=32 /DNA_END=1444 /DNA_ORIENTATION=+
MSSDETKTSESASCTQKDLEAFNAAFDKDAKNELAMNVVTQIDLNKASLSRKARLTHDHVYSVSIPDEAKPVTAQHSTGRCWLFAALNVMRIPFMKEHKLSEFQFSQSYLYFWDHFERCNFFLEQILDTLKEPLDGRLVQYLLSKPIEDGGQFDMIVNIVEKYGVVPRDVFPEVEVTKSSRLLNRIIAHKLREFAMTLRSEHDKNKCDMDKLREIKKEQLKEVWRLMVICFGKPPQQIRWAFRNKDKEHQVLEAESPLDFYNKYVRKFVDVSEQISLVNDPRNEYYKLYTVQRLNNIINGARPHVLYINVPVDVMKKYAIQRLSDGHPVWFGCDVGKHFYSDDGVMDLNNFDYQLLLGMDLKTMTKADRLRYGESLMTHAMVFTAVDLDKDKKPIKWRVENSWSDSRGHKGYCLMTDAWFDEYNYQLVIPKSVLKEDKQILAVLDQKPIELPPWDPMGSLANISEFDCKL